VTIVDNAISAEMESLFHSLQKCLELRDKYMFKSRQRLGDNPKDYDGKFHGLPDDIVDVSGIRPDADYAAPSSDGEVHAKFEPWKIYPRPPPPHWHWTDKHAVADSKHESDEEFEADKTSIPGEHEWSFGLDDKGVYQLYDTTKGL
jgi:AMP deaminase